MRRTEVRSSLPRGCSRRGRRLVCGNRGEGRFEIYVNGNKVYDRKEAGAADFYPSLREIRKQEDVLSAALAESGA